MPKQRSTLDVAEPLKYWRTKRGYAQSKLAELAGTSALTISQLETSKRKARGKTLDKILSGLEVNRQEFFAMRETPSSITATETLEPAAAGTVSQAKPTATVRQSSSIHLSNLDLELLNRILNLDFDAKLDALRFLQNLNKS